MEFEDLNYHENELLLRRLKKYLNYHISTFLLFTFSFFSIILIILLSLVAIIFIPYVIFVLYKNNKYGWIMALSLIIIIPSIILILVVEHTYTLLMFLLIELGMFYFYCFSLRFAVNGWVKEIETVRLTEYQTKKIKAKLGNDRFPT